MRFRSSFWSSVSFFFLASATWACSSNGNSQNPCDELVACCASFSDSVKAACETQISQARGSSQAAQYCSQALDTYRQNGLCKAAANDAGQGDSSQRDAQADASIPVNTTDGYGLRVESARYLDLASTGQQNAREDRSIEIRFTLAVNATAAPAPLAHVLFQLEGTNGLLIFPGSAPSFVETCSSNAAVAAGRQITCSLVFSMDEGAAPTKLHYQTPLLQGTTAVRISTNVGSPSDITAQVDEECSRFTTTPSSPASCATCLQNFVFEGQRLYSSSVYGDIRMLCTGDRDRLSIDQIWKAREAIQGATAECATVCAPPTEAQLAAFRTRIQNSYCANATQRIWSSNNSECMECAAYRRYAIENQCSAACQQRMFTRTGCANIPNECLQDECVEAFEETVSTIASGCQSACATAFCTDQGLYPTTNLTTGTCSAQLQECLAGATTNSAVTACYTQHDAGGTCNTCQLNRWEACSVNTGGTASCRQQRSCWITCLNEQGCQDRACVERVSAAGGACATSSDSYDTCMSAAINRCRPEIAMCNAQTSG